ncbi:MAG: ROK family protein, partial [Proteobacteria bacterium]|nr:ROK family protein [Pseudomonadota bacterium]
IAIPGLVDSQTGTIRFLPNYHWENVNLRDVVQDKIEIPTYIENSANTSTLAEQWFGEGMGIDDFIVVNLEHGVGMGIVINGRLFRGKNGLAGEFGHTTLDPTGPRCRCGKKGCLEAIVGNNAILLEAEAAADRGDWTPGNRDRITIEEVVQIARKGEACLENIYAKAGKILGIGLSNLIEIFNPERIIITGKGVEAGNLLFDSLYETIPSFVSGKLNTKTDIVVRNWNRTDNARGAGTLVLQEIYKSPAD